MNEPINADPQAMVELLDTYAELANNHVDASLRLITDNGGIIRDYLKTYEKVDMGFNLFDGSLFMDYRELFHSRLLKKLLDYEEDGKKKILRSFIDFLDKKYEVPKLDAESAEVHKEKKFIDLLIFDRSTKEAIIIENKLNNAKDQYKQLSRYRTEIEKKYKVLAIVYIPRSPDKKPDDQEEVQDVLHIIPSFNGEGKDLYSWICAAQHDINDINANAILKQYARLLKKIGRNIMSYIELDKFYEKLDVEKYKLALSMRNMLNGFPAYLAERMKEHWEGERAKYGEKLPFEKIGLWRNICGLDFVFCEKLQVVDIYCHERHYELQFFLRRGLGDGNSKGFPIDALKKVGETESWNLDESDSRAKRSFPFDNPQEGENRVKEYLKELFKKLFANV